LFNLGYKNDSVEGSLANGASDSKVSFTGINRILNIIIDNDDGGSNDFTVKFNETTNNERTIKAGESFQMGDVEITDVYLSNASGSAIDYRIFVVGQ
jgi:hypothetical protein